MKRLLIAASALSLLGAAAGAADAQPYHRQSPPPQADNHHNDNRGGHRNWSRGQRLDPSYRTRSHYVDYRSHHLRRPPRGYQWVQADNNFLLIALTTGLIAEIASH